MQIEVSTPQVVIQKLLRHQFHCRVLLLSYLCLKFIDICIVSVIVQGSDGLGARLLGVFNVLFNALFINTLKIIFCVTMFKMVRRFTVIFDEYYQEIKIIQHVNFKLKRNVAFAIMSYSTFCYTLEWVLLAYSAIFLTVAPEIEQVENQEQF